MVRYSLPHPSSTAALLLTVDRRTNHLGMSESHLWLVVGEYPQHFAGERWYHFQEPFGFLHLLDCPVPGHVCPPYHSPPSVRYQGRLHDGGPLCIG